jgi:hypothetical protein
MSQDYHKPEYIDVHNVTANYDHLRQDSGGMVTAHNGVADRLLRNDKLYRSMKGDWKRSGWNGNQNILTTTGREGGKFYIRREQMNTEYIKQKCREYRVAAEAGMVDPLGPYMPDGSIGYKWMDLPDVVAVEISERYFGGMPWNVIKHDRNLKAQFYRVVQQEFPEYVCYPGGRLPIPIDVPYPAAVGETKFFKGHK